MANCNEILLKKITAKPLTDRSVFKFALREDLPDCKRIKTDNYLAFVDDSGEAIDGAALNFNKFLRPNNQFECLKQGCSTTGTLCPSSAGRLIYRAQWDARDFENGVVTFYVQGDGNVEFMISDTDTFANADKYTVAPGNKGADGFKPVVVVLTDAPDSTVGNGYTANRNGAYISIKVPAGMCISSIAIFDSILDFEINDVIEVGCLTSLDGDEELEALQSRCSEGGYSTEDITVERTIVGNKVTGNYRRLNPKLKKDNSVKNGFLPVDKTFIVEADGDYGTVTIPDMDHDRCDFIGVQRNDGCDVTEAMLSRLSIPTKVDLDDGHYFVERQDNGNTVIYFNKALTGVEVIISYPQKAEVERMVANADNIGNVKVSATEIIYYDDGTTIIRTYNNVLITSFPGSLSTEDTEFSFTIAIMKDADGNWYTEDRILV